MSEENVEIARQALEAIGRRDRDAFLTLHDDDFEVVPIRNWPEPGVRGPEASWDFYREAFKVFEQFPIEDVEAIDAGSDKVLLHYRVDLTGQTSPGVDLIRTESAGGFPEYWVVTTIRQGRILRSHWFADRAEALEAAGLSE
jgi:ketosteroid isomerase-like protein